MVGQGGYTFLRNNNGLPIAGVTRLDPAAIPEALQFGYFEDIMLHEFGHAIGLGTAGTCPTGNPMSNANREYQSISQCTTNIPTDQPGCAHYTEDCLVDELMTPVVSPDRSSDRPRSLAAAAYRIFSIRHCRRI